MPTIQDVLDREHTEITTLIEVLLGTDETEAKRRTGLVARLVEQISAHARAEQEVVYPLLAADAGVGALAKEAIEEHGAIEGVLRDLVACDVHDELWIAKLTALRDAVRGHVAREEGEVFDALRRILDDARSEQVAHDFERRKAVLVGQAA